ncbi:aldo/keto reductase [Marinobacterium sp. LSUCC0821]|uniref:aldo/keto reductase n=1 Tax=Marinobacterium sp. LSUCC0821 TaxID=2668067 RepID=UPI0014516075|nr:aldo/keto reductase [Marinobacterium sp. LSUCC0821]QJD72422.1 aldo/keto reductase [Marinobacterium sp. LSUCC0821]
MKIALGTAQFGLVYGVANASGRVPENTSQDIISLARELNVDTLDTAAAYGTSEEVLGRAGIENFKVISKVLPGTDCIEKPASWVNRCIDRSLTNLKCDSLYGLLLHRPLDLLQSSGGELYEALVNLKRQGLVGKIGISVYGPDDLDKLTDFDFDLVQAPMNILDRRLANSGWLEKLTKQGAEVHIRSAFLQGLLLMPAVKRPEYFKPWQKLLSEYDTWVSDQQLSHLQACLGFLSEYSEINKIVVGVDTPEQMRDIVSAANTSTPRVPESIQSTDINFINPGLWRL